MFSRAHRWLPSTLIPIRSDRIHGDVLASAQCRNSSTGIAREGAEGNGCGAGVHKVWVRAKVLESSLTAMWGRRKQEVVG